MSDTCFHDDDGIQYNVDDVRVMKCSDCGETLIGVTRNGITLLETSQNVFQLLADNNIAFHLASDDEPPAATHEGTR